MQPLMMVKKHENQEWKDEEPEIFKTLLEGYRECMPSINDMLLETRYFMNNHILNNDFKIVPKYFLAFDDSTAQTNDIVSISALYVFPKFRNNGFAKTLLDQIKFLAQQNIILQSAVNENKFDELKDFYLKMGFQTTGVVNPPDSLGIKYIDLFWCISPIKLTFTPNGTAIERT
ncbi:hypothetical protein Selin_2346 [Desulfurispirillum indicum S5]|uniref:N-acetyltransferase domain-containing protein n=1 Tax=Desulfurispirillum indicum (strain ATCC BAA-1389 / DSM 22839 / S5) TaxID=653733 RepID=E6W4I9_DESIS|nr:GNAT family N-acetyltransferase [Desulfurispirillum indicum]ADU67062.1 hypothetical protein Selin_2346 [Desulfurispirillum indicum S5]